MRRLIARRARRELLTALLLVAVAFRALIPTGFMPSSERPFSLEICHGGIDARADRAEHGIAGSQSTHDPVRLEQCPFGAAPAQGPLASLLQVIPAAVIVQRSIGPGSPQRALARLRRAQSARAPPFSA